MSEQKVPTLEEWNAQFRKREKEWAGITCDLCGFKMYYSEINVVTTPPTRSVTCPNGHTGYKRIYEG